jgi:hypothetical protein
MYGNITMKQLIDANKKVLQGMVMRACNLSYSCVVGAQVGGEQSDAGSGQKTGEAI